MPTPVETLSSLVVRERGEIAEQTENGRAYDDASRSLASLMSESFQEHRRGPPSVREVE